MHFIVIISMGKSTKEISCEIQKLKQAIMTTNISSQTPTNQQILNGCASQRFFQRIVLWDQTLTIMLLVQLVLLHCYYELDIANNLYSKWFLRGAEACGALACCSILLRYFEPWSKLQRIYGVSECPCGLIKSILMVLIMPYEFTDDVVLNLTYADISSSQHIEYNQKLNYLVTILACFRLGYFGTSVLVRSRYMSPRSGRICKLYGAYPGVMFCLKSIFKDNPFSFVTIIFFISLAMFTFGFRIAENVIYATSPSTTYSNMAWMTVITMTTVGYGDYSPKTQIGRLIGALCVSWGVLIVSVMVVVLTEAFAMNRNESQTLNILKRLETNTELRRVAAEFLRESVWRMWRNYKGRTKVREQMKQRKLMLRFRHFRRLRDMASISQSEIDFYNEMTRQFQRAFINLDNLTANNLMIINYLNEEYIFKGQQDSHPIRS